MQFFEISGTLYALVMAIETVVLLNIIQQGRRLRDATTITRHLVYHVMVMSFGGATTIWMLSTRSYGEAGKWCWIDKSDYGLYFGYIPIWISVLGIVICDAIVVRTVIKSSLLSRKSEMAIEVSPMTSIEGASVSTIVSKTHRTVHIDSAEDKRAKLIAVFVRMILYPLLLIVLFVPGSVVRMTEASIGHSEFIHVFKFAQWICDPAKGTLNALMWVLSDRDVRTELYNKVRSLPFLQQFLAISSVHVHNLSSMTGPNGAKDIPVEKEQKTVPVFSEVPEGHMIRPPWMSEADYNASRYSGEY